MRRRMYVPCVERTERIVNTCFYIVLGCTGYDTELLICEGCIM